MADTPYVLEQRRQGVSARVGLWLRGRRLAIAASLALAEVVALIVFRPSLVLVTAAAMIVLVLAVMGAIRLPKGALRDTLWILALSQAMVVALPLVLGLSVVVGLLVAAGFLVALLLIALRMRI